ncbi:hypothetical protein CTRI78_v011187 [Colletotrichum trifolii]|uniref:Nephrocystin 3-like N-terminal domain-containing protein n=1 Tax=Colletotrichum trifolii TaxID=5466 RepID=A0A4R8QEB4_COLTR|nr:hypothetical protein CTRI78_v011187 [Colletotrichum trifolii]
MAEAFGLAASVFATIQIADRVIGLCKQYIQGVKQARADLRAILVETSTIKATLETVKSVIDLDAGQSDSLSGLGGPLGPVESCRKAIAELEKLLASTSRGTPSGGSRQRIQATYEHLAWPLKRLKARCLLEDMAMQKSTITLILTADSFLTDLLIVIEHALEHFDTVYVTIDALDESQSRENILKVVRDLMTDFRFSKIHLLATSREYLDIEKVVKQVSMEVSMKNPFLDDDIRTYTVACINREERMMSWSQQLRDETEEALVEGAKGMSRWVVCQVDMLKRVRGNGDAIREELRRLPKTLNETYTRIFDQIPEEDAMFVDVALGCMFFCRYLNDCKFLVADIRLCIGALANAVQWEVARTSAQGRHSACDARLLREACGCLVSVTGDNEAVHFAHYTVLEFLEGRSVSDSPKSWRLDSLLPKFEESTLRAILQVTDEDAKKGIAEELKEDKPFRSFAAFGAQAGRSCHSEAPIQINLLLVDPTGEWVKEWAKTVDIQTICE